MRQLPVQRQLPAGAGAPQQGAAAGEGGQLGLNPGCEKFAAFIAERRRLFEGVTNAVKGGKKMEASVACSTFGKIVRNGDQTMKWMTANRAWCGVPPNVLAAIKADNDKVSNIRGQACKPLLDPCAADLACLPPHPGRRSAALGVL